MTVIGITGSIGMGKSAVGAMFERLGVPVHDSDAAVHALMTPAAQGYRAVCAAFPYFEYPQLYKKRKGAQGRMQYLERAALGDLVFNDADERAKLEGILHPLVRREQARFIAAMRRMGKTLVALDIPLLFETGAEAALDFVICVDAPYDIQRSRVLSRPNMTEEKFHAVLAAQMPSAEKQALADYTISTGLSRAQTFQEVKAVLREIKSAAPAKYTDTPRHRLY
ncbi:MAG: dephospho-CoA kinase [Alphaproteobacteria bacterium]